MPFTQLTIEDLLDQATAILALPRPVPAPTGPANFWGYLVLERSTFYGVVETRVGVVAGETEEQASALLEAYPVRLLPGQRLVGREVKPFEPGGEHGL